MLLRATIPAGSCIAWQADLAEGLDHFNGLAVRGTAALACFLRENAEGQE